ncbi:MAG: hypothetical protein ACK2TW_09700 [Anaerolineales bacterium]|jgi:hypothetical protein
MTVSETTYVKTAVSKKDLFWLSGAASILAGILTVIGSLIASSGGNGSLTWIFGLGNIFTLFALIGIYGVQVGKSGWWGLIGFVLASTGNLLLVGGEEQTLAGMNFVLLGSSFSSLGLILLAIGSLRSRAFPRLAPFLWILAPLVGIPGMIAGGLANLFVTLAGVIFGLGFIAAGYYLFTRNLPKREG